MNQALQAVARQYNLSAWAPHETVLTGLRPLDRVTGGIPKGRIVEIFGAEDTGKSALALTIARSFGGAVLYIDAERKLSAAGVYAAYPETLTDALEMCRIAAAAFDVVVVDTLEALPKSNEPIDCAVQYGREYDGERERALSKALPILDSTCRAHGCTLILVNQIRNRPDIMYGRPDHPTGGWALRYYAALRLELFRTGIIKKGIKPPTGQKIGARVQKCKYGRPFGEAELILDYAAGVRA